MKPSGSKMLYIFRVDTGSMMTLEMSLALETVAHLRRAVASTWSIPEDKQVGMESRTKRKVAKIFTLQIFTTEFKLNSLCNKFFIYFFFTNHCVPASNV